MLGHATSCSEMANKNMLKDLLRDLPKWTLEIIPERTCLCQISGIFSKEVHALNKFVAVSFLTPWDKWFPPCQPAKCWTIFAETLNKPEGQAKQ